MKIATVDTITQHFYNSPRCQLPRQLRVAGRTLQNQPGTTLMTVSDLGQIDAEVKKIVWRAYERAKKLITDNTKAMHRLARTLLEKEVLDLQKAHFGLRMQKATQQLGNTATLGETRRAIARAKTILAQKQAAK